MRRSHFCLALSAVTTLVHPGCHLGKTKPSLRATTSATPSLVSQLRQSDAIESVNMPLNMESVSPLDLDEASLTPDRFQNISLQECIASALATSRVMRDMGVTVIRNPQGTTTNLDPAIVYTDARSGEEAALSAFDANFFASNFFENNDRAFNNSFFGQSGQFQQDLNTSQFGLSKRSATGGLYTLRGVSVFDRNNQASNRPEIGNSAWDNFLEAQFRQPLLLGAGTEFNRIAGPGAQPGQLNGVLLARTRTDINLVDFERSVRDYLAEVENAYWDLYYAYRELDARIQVRDIAEKEVVKLDEKRADVAGSSLDQAQEQLYRFKADVVDALNGRPIDGTRTNNGSSGGTFRGTGGVRVCERKLRLMIGLPINDGVLLHTSDRPSVTKVEFDWAGSIQEALTLREELRRQRWVIKQRELELIASRHFRKPQLDAVSTYRMRGFGDDFTHPFGEDLHEWGLGLDMQMPVGFRRGNAAVRNAQLALSRETEILAEQERAVHFGLSNAINEARRAHENLSLQEKRLLSIVSQLQKIEEEEKSGRSPEIDVRLETQRRLLDARLRYHQSEVEYALALRNVNVERGTLLRYCNVWLNETSPSSEVMAKSVRRTNAQDYSVSPDNRDIVIGNPRVP